jgi:hypothetical protein
MVIRTTMNAGIGESCCELFKHLNILPFQSQYVLSLSLFVVKKYVQTQLNVLFH